MTERPIITEHEPPVRGQRPRRTIVAHPSVDAWKQRLSRGEDSILPARPRDSLPPIEVSEELLDAPPLAMAAGLGGRLPTTEVLAEEGGYDNLLAGTVADLRGDAAGLSLAGGIQLTVPGRGLERGDRVVLGLRGDDVLVATEDPGLVSARNVLEGAVARAVERGAYTALGVEVPGVDGGLTLETHVTEGALRDLELAPGRRVLLLFKTRSLELLSRAPARLPGPPGPR